ncbi:MAG: RsmB/NOP family class I SAM-dependent RNA methyltransferase [Flavobacteriaceae bacterium]
MKLHQNLALGIISCLEMILKDKKALKSSLKQLLKTNRNWGSRDRRFIGEAVLEIIRWKRKFSEMGKLDPKLDRYYWNLLGVWILYKDIPLPDWENFSEINKKSINFKLNPKSKSRAIKQSIPDWLDDLGIKSFGKTLWEKEIESLNETAPLVLRVNIFRTTAEKLQNIFKKKYAIESKKTPEYPYALFLDKHRKLDHLELFRKGWFEIQDANSQRVSVFAAPKPGMTVIDACAGAGGKTLHMANIMQNKGSIIALDPNNKKLEQLKIRIKRNGIRIVTIHNLNNENYEKKYKTNADLVLIDAPCSGLGVLRRNPAAKWQMNPTNIQKLIYIQQEILQKQSIYVKRGGILVYSTCSIFPDENENQIKNFLATGLGKFFYLEKEETFLTHQSKGDGFYMARLIKS